MIYGKKDPQDVAPVAHCIHCGGEIYPHEKVWQPDGYDGLVHIKGCRPEWLDNHYANDLGAEVEVPG